VIGYILTFLAGALFGAAGITIFAVARDDNTRED
jgi:hypothetical protein